MAKRSGFKVLVDNVSLSRQNFDATVDYASFIGAERIRSAAESARDLMIERIRDDSLKSDYSHYREDKGIARPNYYHKDKGGSYDSVTKALVVFDNAGKDISTGSNRFTMGVGARQRGMGSVQNNYMPASLALELIDEGFSNNQGLVPLTHGRQQIKSHWAVSDVEGKHFTRGVSNFMADLVSLEIKRAEVVIQGKFAQGWDGPTTGTQWKEAARKYYRSLRNDGGYEIE